MMSRLKWIKMVFLRYYRDMGLRVLLYALLSVVATLVSPLANAMLGEAVKAKIDFEAVLAVLTILASSMLAVSTFSLNIMVSAHRAAAANATPRVHRILLEDTTTQSVLAAFIGAFVYSLGSIVLYHLGFYDPDSAFFAMMVTVAVVILVVVSLLRWIEHLTMLGSVEESLNAARDRARESLLALARNPRHGASPLSQDTVLPQVLTPLPAPRTGILQLIDMASLEDCLPHASVIYLKVRPGSHVLEGETLGHVSGTMTEDVLDQIADQFTFGVNRTHEQDAEFGLTVLSEIASKALSPGINDPGTAIEALMALKSVLWAYAQEAPAADASSSPRVFVAFPEPADFVEAAFAAIARDGAGTIEVALTLRKALAALAECGADGMADAVRAFADRAMLHAQEAGLPERSLERLRAVEMPEAG
ncbi:DUF2254 domain-containing protein [uncultured Tateyamaria sp.]|uniref:DUF2254 domain-containing protein n=1 Tax=uncultured Tateyamaria sp. TaxID=455651 RepID=UPI00262DD348|nr:DUF2254 domain-containing protein [uncultured Tateyamaria sp.]